MSNFDYLAKQFPAFCQAAKEAEQLANTSPKASAVLSRSAMELAVIWMYENERSLTLPYNYNLSGLIKDYDFRAVVGQSIFQDIHLIKNLGNNGAHGKSVSLRESTAAIQNLFRFFSFFGYYYGNPQLKAPAFDLTLLPDGQELNRTKAQLSALATQQETINKELKDAIREKEELAKYSEELEAEIKNAKALNSERRIEREKLHAIDETIPRELPEAEARRLYIDSLLKDAGWENLVQGKDLEYPVVGMPQSTNPSGKGRADYVLWGDDGLPLAVIEAKRTMLDAAKGKHQAFLYANALEQMHGQRPIIFYSNGFETHIWDDTFSIPRNVSGFYTKDELQRAIDRRKDRKDPRNFKLNTAIAGRPYQLEAAKRVAENMCISGKDGNIREAHRGTLLVMATGSGKTRTAAALVDMLSKCNWVKRVLFLADRNALVTQAQKSFNEHLPHLSSVDLTEVKEEQDSETRLVFSTYPTIMNKIDEIKSGDARFYGVGNFDLIIIDEAHRSVYQKYKAIFDYFDAQLIGLTATPKTEIDHNTYGLFDIEDDNPTFAYELTTAVEQGYLVPARSLSVPLKFQREGIKYKELSEAEKREYEEKFGDPTIHEAADEIGSSALNKWLFNTDTVDKVLAFLMQEGIKVAGGDKLGKTIIFAKNHAHAVFIEERFNKNYPEYGGHFLRVIDNYEPKAKDLLEKFADPYAEVNPQIAVSVDMMDTGVDAPRVVNLVFFKQVKSVTKFWQMIGRGTRLCPDLFAPGEDKKEFLILDFCENFEFFEEFPDGLAASHSKPLLQQIFESRFDVAMLIANLQDKTDSDREIRELYLDTLHSAVSNLDKERFVVRQHLRYVEKFKQKESWINLNTLDENDIKKHLSHLEPSLPQDDELARRFDLLSLKLQIALLRKTNDYGRLASSVIRTATALQKKENLPGIKEQLTIIREVQKDEFWANADTKSIEQVRIALRDLIKYLDKKSQVPVFTHFEDELDLGGVMVKETMMSYGNLQSYKDRVESYVRKNRFHLSIDKLSKNIPITAGDLAALEEILFTEEGAKSKEKFIAEYGEQPLGTFIRKIVGLDQAAAREAFADFLQAGNLESNQMTFINAIITHLTINGTIDKGMLFEPPFTNIHSQGITGIFKKEKELNGIIRTIDVINGNAVA